MGENEHREESVISHLQRSLQRIDNFDRTLTDQIKDLDEDVDKVFDQNIEILAGQVEIKNLLNQVLKAIGNPNQNVMHLQFKGEQLDMPGKETDTQTVSCSEVETDAAGNAVTLNPANVTWSIDDPTIATLTQNADGTATFKGLKPGIAIVTCTDNGTTPPTVGTDSLEVTSTGPNKLTLVFGTPA